ncbi:hypothetical protein MKK58_02970 [Methylobacterium sp. J-078]|uniref:flagellin N-terminal helical domain-containing protein n=1 Tax=Methylobacterium sp. J-078 TaxID=2836657 RepID=UPI001FBA5ED1|nr:flagellin [Methylobacterium sp. J-078]MCJ2043505.1 hypothetical protein [Methylobacterium sp. J-078]
MSSGITLSAATRQNLLSLQGTADLLSTTQSRLSTGKKVNSALDNPTSFFTSQSLTSRSTDLSSLLNGMSNGVQTIQAANQGITSIQKLLDSAKSTASQALADKTGGTSSTISGGHTALAATVTGTSSYSALAGTPGTRDFSDLANDASVDISVDGGKTTSTIRLDATTLKSATTDLKAVTTDQILSAVKSQISSNSALAGKVTASTTPDGKLSFATVGTGSSQAITVRGSAGSNLDIGFGVSSVTPTAPKVTADAALASTTRFDGGQTAQLTVYDGNKTVTVNLDGNSATDAVGGTLAATGGTVLVPVDNKQKIADAINLKLTAEGSTAKATVDSGSGKLVFTSAEKGPDATVTVSGGVTTAGGPTGLGFSKFTAAVGKADGTVVQNGTAGVAPAPDTASTITLGQAIPNSVVLSGGQSASFSVQGSGGTLTTVTLNKEAISTGSTKLGPTPSRDDVLAAINTQLTAGAAGATASFDASGQLKFSSTATGTAATVAVTATNDTIGLGLGTTAGTVGVLQQGAGQAATGQSSAGSDATDGSSKAIVSGTGLTVASGKTEATLDLSSGKDASFTIKLGTGTTKIIKLDNTISGASATTSQAAILKSINDQISQDTGLNGNVEAKFVNNKLVVQTTASGSDQKLTVQAYQSPSSGANADQIDIGFGLKGNNATAQSNTGTDVGGGTGTSSTRAALAKQFNQILSQITQQAQDSGYNGVNLLYRTSNKPSDNTLQMTFNESNTSALNIEGVRFDADGLGLKTTSGDFQSDDDIRTAIDQLTNATTTLRAQSSTFGSNLSVVQNRQDFTKSMTNILDTGSANLVNADLNEEAANSQALSTRNSLAISALSLANQAQQGILQLLR